MNKIANPLIPKMQVSDPKTGWSDEEEHTIATIQQAESVSRPEAIRRMQRRKKTSGRASLRREPVLAAGRLCRNSRCTQGNDGGPGSLVHLRADALYCNDACRKAAQRSPNRQNKPSNRQCLCGSKADKNGSLLSPHHPAGCPARIVSNSESRGIENVEKC